MDTTPKTCLRNAAKVVTLLHKQHERHSIICLCACPLDEECFRQSHVSQRSRPRHGNPQLGCKGMDLKELVKTSDSMQSPTTVGATS